jgi:hypothetical protein
MNSIEDKLNIKEMYKFQIEEMNTGMYPKYIKYLEYFYMKNTKKEKYDKKFLDGTYILIDKNNPKKIIKITPSQFINIHTLYNELKNYTNLILEKISDMIESKNNINENDRKEFDYLKIKFTSFKEKIKDIESIDKEFYDEINSLVSEKIEKINNLNKYYQKRNEIYKDINTMIKENLKKNLIKIFKDNKKIIPSIKEINKIAKDNAIPSVEIEKWFNWIETVYFYLIIKNEIMVLNKKIESKEIQYDILGKYMIIKKPIIQD